MGWVRSQFEDNYREALLDPPPRGKLEEYARRILTETSRNQSDDDVDDELHVAREAMSAAAAVLLEFAARGRPRKPRYAAAAPKPSYISIRNRTSEIRARYGSQS